ncbi:MAG: ATP-binding protein [Nitrospirota bacterium]|nr:ATP-binding protein [Nitrospirota bacterium]
MTSYFSLRRLIIRLIERFCPFNVKIFQVLVGIITTILLGTVLILGWMSSKEVKEVVTKDFNQQQLVLAQHAARQIENNINLLKKEISLLSLSPSIQYFEKVSLGKRMQITFSSIKEEGILEIQYIESSKSKTHLVNNRGYRIVSSLPENLNYLDWAGQVKNKGKILINEVISVSQGDKNPRITMKMVLPVWQVSVDESHPLAINRFSGVLMFVVDASSLIEKITKSITSGRTGYAWVIDEKGIFLFHPEREFIGKNAFEARKEKKPTISFDRINEIQKEMMLGGKEGTSWYISGWHRGVEGEMKKLIAYTPIHLTESRKQLWSVAVAAPISEVEDSVHSIQVRQFLLQAIIICVILLGGVTIIFLILNWSTAMEQEVDRKTIELKKSEQRYKSLVENAEDIIFTVDYNGNYLSINKYGARFFNKAPEDITGHNMSEILQKPDDEVSLTTIKEVFDRKKGKQITHLVKLDEQEYWFNTNFRRLLDKEGNIYAVLGISRDITDRKKMEETSYHTEKLASMGTLAAGVAHEINNPLGIILGFTDMLLEKAKPESQEQEILKTIEKHGIRAKRVVENLLSFARYSECKEAHVDINKSISAVLTVVENTLLLNKISMNLQVQDNLPEVKGCSEELQQVFFNIMNNAVSAMKGGGALTITTRALSDNRHIEIRFSDTGHGIKKEYRRKIFDPLFTTKKTGEGTGLGLSVSYGIIAKHGGTIDFETKTKEDSEETGTTFIITLPAITTPLSPPY